MIEMLVVISILGILAAIATMSVVGITSLARQRANEGEMMAVQSALDFMLMDQGLSPEDACTLYLAGPAGTNDMAQFPSDRPWTKHGGTGVPVQLYPQYLRKQHLNRRYVCTGAGSVTPAG